MAVNAPLAVNNEMIALEGGEATMAAAAEATTDTAAQMEDNLSTTASSDDEMGVRHCFYDFCKQTILHGWHYLADLENDATPSPSFVTFTPVSSPHALAGM